MDVPISFSVIYANTLSKCCNTNQIYSSAFLRGLCVRFLSRRRRTPGLRRRHGAIKIKILFNKRINRMIITAFLAFFAVASLVAPAIAADKQLKSVAVTVGDLGNPFFVQVAHG